MITNKISNNIFVCFLLIFLYKAVPIFPPAIPQQTIPIRMGILKPLNPPDKPEDNKDVACETTIMKRALNDASFVSICSNSARITKSMGPPPMPRSPEKHPSKMPIAKIKKDDVIFVPFIRS